MSTNQIRAMELRRLHELELQAAQYGPHTDPGVFIEIQELRTKYPHVRSDRNGEYDRDEFLLLLNQVAGMLVRLTQLEQLFNSNNDQRKTRQLIHDLWMIVITVVSVVTLLLVLSRW